MRPDSITRTCLAALVALSALVALTISMHGVARAEPLTLDASRDAYPLLLELEVIADPSGALDPHDLLDASLQPVAQLDGAEGEVVWMRATVVVPPGAPAWYFVLAPPFDPGTLYLEADGGALWAEPFAPEHTRGAPFLAELPRTPGPHRLLLRLPLPHMLPSLLHVATLDGVAALVERQTTPQGLYLGVILTMLLVNLLLGVRLRDPTHLWYVAFVASSAAYFALNTGTINRTLAPSADASDLFRPALTFLVAMVVAGVEFSRRFLDTRKSAPRVDRVMRIYLVASAPVAVLAWVAPPGITLLALTVVGALLPFIVLTAGVVSWRSGQRAARFYLLAWSLYTLGGFLFAVPLDLPLGMPQALFQLGSALEAMLLSLALVDRLRLMRDARERAERDAIRSERLATLGQLVAGVAHEVNNPNNFLTFNLPIVLDYLEATRPHVETAVAADPHLRLVGLSASEFYADAATLVGHMQHGARRITDIVAQLRTYARAGDDAEWHDGDVNAIVRAASTLVAGQLAKSVSRFDVRLGEGLPLVRMNAGRLEQVIMNLLVNAGHAVQSGAGSRVAVSTARDGDDVVVTVEDDGPGVPPELQQRVFEPFFTTKAREVGTGLGLAISKRIVDEHDGTLTLASAPGATRFVIRLPVPRGSA